MRGPLEGREFLRDHEDLKREWREQQAEIARLRDELEKVRDGGLAAGEGRGMIDELKAVVEEARTEGRETDVLAPMWFLFKYGPALIAAVELAEAARNLRDEHPDTGDWGKDVDKMMEQHKALDAALKAYREARDA